MTSPESRICRKVMAAIRERYPHAFVVKLSDRMTRGLPDILAIYTNARHCLVVLALEVKTAKGKPSKLQEITLDTLEMIASHASYGGLVARVVRSESEVKELMDVYT